ncbi:MAG: hypothetical protein ACYCWW_16575 [Deltaproteobacteria bacterium]
MRPCALLCLAACAVPMSGPPPSPCSDRPDHAAKDHFEGCVGADLSLFCCLDGLAECTDPFDPYGAHECGPPEPCLDAYFVCADALQGGGPEDRRRIRTCGGAQGPALPAFDAELRLTDGLLQRDPAAAAPDGEAGDGVDLP